MNQRHVGIVGTGNVGVAAGYAMFVRQIVDKIVLVDINARRAEGEARDLMHGQGLVGRVQVESGDYAALASCRVIVITAGVAQRDGESRLDLLQRNAAILHAIARELDRHAPDAILVVASNPVDILTYILQEVSARPNERIIGTGTMLDTSRFRTLLGEYYQVNPTSVHGYILAEHGDSEFAAWSTVSIGGQSLMNNVILGRPFDRAVLEALFAEVRSAAHQIIQRKGYTNWAIGLVISTLVAIILGDQKAVQPISVRLNGEYGLTDVCLSVPARIGAHGVERLVELDLLDDERAALEQSARLLKASVNAVGVPSVS